MAGIDDKITALEFTRDSSKTRDQVRLILDDAARVVQGEKLVLTDVSDSVVSGVARNFVRVQHAQFRFTLTPGADGGTRVGLRIPDYLRVRETMLAFIPVSPWTAPAYKTLRELSGYVSSRL
ncbi:hypothetical protein [Rathayibacter sp. VKM Ac-2760]|uniref:hypothetical protein n=1 Tax=Rathayibacter sp. VKM Ac-2760 TaxID=2609253 RepID=UPI001315C27A|nr:hypothetical protein [Rathayibacter sp. VKM Ac-2760]QHC57598.1 hypothetical protein GSU72_02615 [Rathayibacter sp. VKM Ac-2760]